MQPNSPLHHGYFDSRVSNLLKLAGGMAVNRIGDELSLRETTVRTYRTTVLRTMGFKSEADMTMCALRNGVPSQVRFLRRASHSSAPSRIKL
jgi:DNA-binding NarL/FixJ family response regulator